MGRPNPADCLPQRDDLSLDDLAVTLEEYLESAKHVAVAATKNVEDAYILLEKLKSIIENKKA